MGRPDATLQIDLTRGSAAPDAMNHAVFPLVLVNQGLAATLQQATSWVRTNGAALIDRAAETGAVLFRGFAVQDALAFDA